MFELLKWIVQKDIRGYISANFEEITENARKLVESYETDARGLPGADEGDPGQ